VTTKVGVFGGTFDPIHVGHLAMASAVSHRLQLDAVLFVVAHRPWQKVGTRPIADSALRFAMVQAATAGRDDFEASSIEIDRGGLSYTIDTVETLQVQRPGAQLVVIVGSDVVADLDSWHRHDELKRLCTLAVVDRPGTIGAEPPPGWTYDRVRAPLVDLSSSMLRQRLADGEPVDYLVPAEALQVWNKWQADQPARTATAEVARSDA
jgi:nicotinate-nucleotide adenylyltransferase